VADLASWRRRADALAGVPPLAVDTAIAVLCYLATVALPVKVAADGGWPLFVLAALASLPLVWRRRQPVVACALVGVGTVGLAITGPLGDIPLPYGQLVATYTVASLAPPLWRLVVMAGTAVGVVFSVLVLLGQGPATLALAGLPFVVAYALGTGVRARRDRITMLEERTRRLADAQRATAARERERIAREIHDIVAHSVSLMVVQAEAGLVLAGDAERAARTFDTISGTGREALTQLDRALGVLRGHRTRRPQPGLGEVPELVERARLAGLAAHLEEHGRSRPVPADLATAVYRLVQEAVTNTVKHAGARKIAVRLDWRETALAVEVCDDGRGVAAAGHGRPGDGPFGERAGDDPAGPGHGLVGMRERVHAFGGDLRAGPGADGVGFRVTATLPLLPPGDGTPDG
jgi:signal transduction histidine kinase